MNVKPGEDVPDSLFDQCIKYVGRNLNVLADTDPVSGCLRLKIGLTLPNEICDKLLEVYQKVGGVVDDKFVTLFENPGAARLKRIKLKNSAISDDGLKILVNCLPVELDISNCRELTEKSLTHINERGINLVSLSFGLFPKVLPRNLRSKIIKNDEKNFNSNNNYILKTPNLKKLTIRNLIVEINYFDHLLKPLEKLTYLDLSGCYTPGGLTFLVLLQNLTSLILYNVQDLNSSISCIEKLKNLKHLDISMPPPTCGTFRDPSSTLASLVQNLPNLISLDISGTNLTERGN